MEVFLVSKKEISNRESCKRKSISIIRKSEINRKQRKCRN